MKKIVLLIMGLMGTVIYAEQNAITDTGEKVILHTDKTWEYSKQTTKIEITTNTEKFATPENAKFLLKSTKNNTACWLNSDLWSFEKASSNAAAEYKFRLKGSDLYAMSVAEAVPIPMESLSNIALKNARDVAPDVKIVRREYRVVNGTKVLFMEMKGTTQGIKFTYLGYYYSDDLGSTQLVTYTGTNLVKKYKSKMMDFLNGFTIQ